MISSFNNASGSCSTSGRTGILLSPAVTAIIDASAPVTYTPSPPPPSPLPPPPPPDAAAALAAAELLA